MKIGGRMEKKVVELFAGVGGFRIGLNSVKLQNNVVFEEKKYDFVWVNQWEPSTKTQHAFDCYENRFGVSPSHSNEDISKVDKNTIPNHSLLVGGFPCQDYSVARSLSKEKGIEGKKGVLWWEIESILRCKMPPFVLLENVDRLLKSPSKQRGRDFGIMLRCFDDLGYSVQWKIINAAEYGHPQKRRRIFIFAYRNSTSYHNETHKNTAEKIILDTGLFPIIFPVTRKNHLEYTKSIKKDSYKTLVDVSDNFYFNFENSGVMHDGEIFTVATIALPSVKRPLKSILQRNLDIEKYKIGDKKEKFIILKGSKKIQRVKNGVSYFYSEGSMSFPENLDEPGRTMLTSEGTTNRSTHVVEDIDTGILRFLTPIEAERLNEFPDNWTNTGMPEKRRYFMMGNALVVGIVEKLGKSIYEIIDKE